MSDKQKSSNFGVILNSLDRMSKRQKVQYSGMGGEPAFLAAFKKKVGYQEPKEDVDMEAKKAKLMKDFDERELDDEVFNDGLNGLH